MGCKMTAIVALWWANEDCKVLKPLVIELSYFFWFRCEKIQDFSWKFVSWLVKVAESSPIHENVRNTIFIYDLWSNLCLKGFPFWGRGQNIISSQANMAKIVIALNMDGEFPKKLDEGKMRAIIISRSDFCGNIHPESLSKLWRLFALSNKISKNLVFAYFYQIILCTTYLYIALYLRHYRKCKFFHEKIEFRYWYNYCRHSAPSKKLYDLFVCITRGCPEMRSSF